MARYAFHLLLGLSLAALAVLLAIILLPGASEPTARAHTEIPGMLQSAGRPEGAVWWLGAAFGLLTFAIMGALVGVGVRKRGRATPLSGCMWAGMAGYAANYVLLLISYAAYSGTSDVPFFAGFPVPSAWLAVGIFLYPLVLVALYTLHFDRWVLTPEDRRRFDELLEARDTEPT